MNKSCTIVTPCYNEEKRFPLEQFAAFAQAHPAIRFLLVNDGSRDDTLAILARARLGREQQIDLLDQIVNTGKGEAVRAGMLHALKQDDCAYAGFWDADLATPLDAIERLASVLDANPHISMVFGSRVKLLGRHIERKAIRHYLGRIFATVVSTLLQLPIYDTQCGAKIFRSSPETCALFAAPFSSRWVFDVEILARFIQQRGYRVDEVATSIYEYPLEEWRDVAGSQVRPLDFFRAFLDVVRIHARYRR